MTQGSPKEDKWVKSYILSYYNGFPNPLFNRWTNYTEEDGSVKIFEGNSDRSTVRMHILKQFYAEKIRIYPVTWNNGICMRIDLRSNYKRSKYYAITY
ncbi:Retinoschisin [Exaiptasia diaphana]|nr:Retinoschisin [Exaiptasia diaphana]